MREITFRGRSLEEIETDQDGIGVGDWVYGQYYYCKEREAGVIVTSLLAECGGVGSGTVQVTVEIDIKTLGQYTGISTITNKNKENVYEGDICKYSSTGFIGEVCYTTLVACSFRLWGINSDEIKELALTSDLERIGNKHDNPELLIEENKC